MTTFELFLFFLRISCVTFGGGIVILGMAELELSKRDDISEEELADIVSLSASVPGPIAVSISWLVGRYYRGLRGSIAALAGMIIPPFLVILFVSPFVIKYSAYAPVQGFFKGVLAGTAAIITVTILKNVKNAVWGKWWNLLPYLLVIGMIGGLHLHPLPAILITLALLALKERFVKC